MQFLRIGILVLAVGLFSGCLKKQETTPISVVKVDQAIKWMHRDFQLGLMFIAMINNENQGFFPSVYPCYWEDSTISHSSDSAVRKWSSNFPIQLGDGWYFTGEYTMVKFKEWHEIGKIAVFYTQKDWISTQAAISNERDTNSSGYWELSQPSLGNYQLNFTQTGNHARTWKMGINFNKGIYDKASWSMGFSVAEMEYITQEGVTFNAAAGIERSENCQWLFSAGRLNATYSESLAIDFNPFGNKACEGWYKIQLGKVDEYLLSY